MEETQNTNQENISFNAENENPKRSIGLSILLVLTFIVSGLFALSYLGIGVSYNDLMQKIQDGTLFSVLFPEGSISSNILESYNDWAGFYFSQGKLPFFMYFILEIAAIVGAYFMWNMKKLGFYFYSAAKVLLLILPLLLLGRNGLDMGALMFTALFVGIYMSNFRKFH